MSALWGSFPAHQEPPDATLAWQPDGWHWQLHATGASGLARCTPALAPALSGFLIGKLLHELHPRWIQLHGNSLVGHGSTVLLCGESGAGKSTLSALLAASGYLPFAEDLLLLDPERDALHPFPRGVGVRNVQGGVHLPGPGRPDRQIAPVAKLDAAGLPLSAPTVVVLLERMPGQTTVDPGHHLLTLTGATDELVVRLTPARVQRLPGDLVRLEWDTAPAASHVAALCEGSGAFILRWGPPHAPPGPVFDLPMIEPVEPFPALTELLRHWRRYEWAASPQGALMQMGALLGRGNCRFLRLRVGGTAEETANVLAGALKMATR